MMATTYLPELTFAEAHGPSDAWLHPPVRSPG